MHTIVHHFDIVASAGLTHPISAGISLNLSRGLLENLLDGRPGSRRTTGHERGTITGAFLTTRHTRPNEEKSLSFEFLDATDCIGIVRVSAVYDYVTLFEMGGQLFDEIIYSGPSFNEKDDLARTLEFCNELFYGVCTLNIGSWVILSLDWKWIGRGVKVPLASFARKWSTLEVVRLYATTLKPLSFMLRMRFWP